MLSGLSPCLSAHPGTLAAGPGHLGSCACTLHTGPVLGPSAGQSHVHGRLWAWGLPSAVSGAVSLTS